MYTYGILVSLIFTAFPASTSFSSLIDVSDGKSFMVDAGPGMRFVMYVTSEAIPESFGGICKTDVSFHTRMFPANINYKTFAKAGNTLLYKMREKEPDKSHGAISVKVRPEEYVLVFSTTRKKCSGKGKKYHLKVLKDPKQVDRIVSETISSIDTEDYISHQIELLEQPYKSHEPSFWVKFMGEMRQFMNSLDEEEQQKVKDEIEQQRAAGIGTRG